MDYHRFDYLRRFGHAPTEYAFVAAVRRQLETLHAVRGIDLVMCHSHTLAALAARSLKAKCGVPYGLVVHGDIFDRPRGTYDPLLTALYRAVTPRAYRDADLVLAVSPHMASRALARGAAPPAVVVVPNGIDPSEIGVAGRSARLSRGLSPRDSRLRLLYVGRFSVEKGVGVLVHAYRLVRDRGVDFESRLIGDGPLENELRKAVSDAGLSDRVTFVGRLERRALGPHYEWADVVCVPSLSEPFGVVVLEALAVGRPVVGTDVGGIPWMIENGATGIIVPAGSAVALADAIAAIAKDPIRLGELAANAASSGISRFSWSHIGDRLRDLVEGAVGRTRGVSSRREGGTE